MSRRPKMDWVEPLIVLLACLPIIVLLACLSVPLLLLWLTGRFLCACAP